ncbi:MAG TPA: MFS transporter [Chloroflexota bacterium]|nr:MFS transporter [Chloroflexota bacterium]
MPAPETPSAPNLTASRRRAWPVGLIALDSRDFRLLWSGALVSNIGTWLQAVAQGWLVLQLTNSAFLLGMVNAVGTLPVMTLSLYGGVLADQMDRRLLLILAQSALLVLTLAMAALTGTHVINVGWLLLLVFVIGSVAALSSPAWQSFVGDLVPKASLMNAIALNSAQFNVARVVGPAMAGTLIAIIGIAGCFTLNGLSFLAVVVALGFMRRPLVNRETSKVGAWRSVVDGVKFAAGHAESRAILLLATVHTIFGMPFLMLMPVFAKDVYHGSAGDLGALLAAMGAGAVVGALVTARLGAAPRKGLIILGMEVVFTLALFAFALMPSRLPAMFALAVVGFWMVSFFAIANTALQILSHEEMRGRVMALWTIASWGISPVGSLWAGALANRIGAQATVAIGAGVCLLYALATAALSASLREL